MDDSRFTSLTPREIECLKGVAQHKRTKDIASDLKLSPKTVDAYIANAVRKLGYTDRDTAVRALMSSSAMIAGFSSSAISGVENEVSTASSSWLERLPWPFPTRGRPTNDLSYPGTIVAIMIAASLMIAAMSIYILAIRIFTEHP